MVRECKNDIRECTAAGVPPLHLEFEGIELPANCTTYYTPQRVIMLCGSPGMGKTTLAHVIAKHAGYEPMEINASDDRTADKIREAVIRAMESKRYRRGCCGV